MPDTETEDLTKQKIGMQGKMALAVAIAVSIGAIIVCFVSAGFDPTRIDWPDWAVNCGINEAIAFIMMFCGESFYMAYCTTIPAPNGKYQTALKAYEEAYNDAKDYTDYMGQYLRIRHEKESKNAGLNYLIDHGIENARSVIKLDIKDIPNLKSPYKKVLEDGTTLSFKSYTKTQIRVIKKVLEGEVVVKRVPKSFFLDVENDTIGKSEYAQAGMLKADKDRIKASNRSTKSISMALCGMVMAGIFIVGVAEGNDPKTWFTIVMRLLTAITTFWTGCRTSFQVNKKECQGLNIKKNFLKDFVKFMNEHPNYFFVTDDEYDAMEEVRQLEEKEEKEETENGQNAARQLP